MINFRFIVGSVRNILITLSIILTAFIALFIVAMKELLMNQNFILPVIWFLTVPFLIIIMKKLSTIFILRKAEKMINDIEK